MRMLDLAVPCARGLEPLVVAELEALGAERCVIEAGAVRAAGTWETVWRANLGLRLGRRVLVSLLDWAAPTAAALEDGLIDGVSRDPGLRELLSPDRTVAVHGASSRSRLNDPRAIGGMVREALRRAQRGWAGRSSPVAPRGPDLPLRVRVFKDVATLLIDTSGAALDARGGMDERRGSPRATVCAALFAAAEWDGEGGVCDPFAGDGRVLEEAVAACEGWMPGRSRHVWPFERLNSFDPERFAELRDGALDPVAPGCMLWAGDPNQRYVRDLRGWARGLGVDGRMRSRHTDPLHLAAPADRGLLVTAPPPGASPAQWGALGEALKHRFPNWTAVLLCREGWERHLGLRPRRKLVVRDGDLRGVIVVLDLWVGRRRDRGGE